MRIEKVKGKDLKLGMKVLNEDFEVGTVDYICDCEKCEERGFFELTITYKDYKDFVTVYNKEVVFNVLKEISEAKEMFDVLGFRVLEDTERYLRYIKTEDEEIKLYSWGQIVDFDKRDKTIRVRSQLNIAINKQIEELGWK